MAFDTFSPLPSPHHQQHAGYVQPNSGVVASENPVPNGACWARLTLPYSGVTLAEIQRVLAPLGASHLRIDGARTPVALGGCDDPRQSNFFPGQPQLSSVRVGSSSQPVLVAAAPLPLTSAVAMFPSTSAAKTAANAIATGLVLAQYPGSALSALSRHAPSSTPLHDGGMAQPSRHISPNATLDATFIQVGGGADGGGGASATPWRPTTAGATVFNLSASFTTLPRSTDVSMATVTAHSPSHHATPRSAFGSPRGAFSTPRERRSDAAANPARAATLASLIAALTKRDDELSAQDAAAHLVDECGDDTSLATAAVMAVLTSPAEDVVGSDAIDGDLRWRRISSVIRAIPNWAPLARMWLAPLHTAISRTMAASSGAGSRATGALMGDLYAMGCFAGGLVEDPFALACHVIGDGAQIGTGALDALDVMIQRLPPPNQTMVVNVPAAMMFVQTATRLARTHVAADIRLIACSLANHAIDRAGLMSTHRPQPQQKIAAAAQQRIRRPVTAADGKLLTQRSVHFIITGSGKCAPAVVTRSELARFLQDAGPFDRVRILPASTHSSSPPANNNITEPSTAVTVFVEFVSNVGAARAVARGAEFALQHDLKITKLGTARSHIADEDPAQDAVFGRSAANMTSTLSVSPKFYSADGDFQHMQQCVGSPSPTAIPRTCIAPCAFAVWDGDQPLVPSRT
jgi:hypothetical protein